MQKNNISYKKIIIGAIVTILGIIMVAWGHNQQQSFEYQLAKAFESTEDTIGIDFVFYFGLIILIVGLILLVINIIKKFTTEKLPITPAQANSISTLKMNPVKYRCAECGTVLNEEMQFCPNCGSREKFKNLAEQEPQSKQTFCSQCGTEISPDEMFCHQCGNKNNR